MIIWRIVLFLFYLDGEIFHLICEGRPIPFILIIALTISNIQIATVYYPIWKGVGLFLKKILYPHLDEETIRFGKRLWTWLKKWKGSSLAERWAKRWQKIVKHRYLILFLLNFFPVPQFTMCSIIIVRLSRESKKIGILTIMAGNATKFFVFVPLLHYLLLGG